ncbi:AAA family ATPase [Bifidobacterium eulemuris]|uniref:AAA domain-containing protein n=1 Tax=Bifidobacterium eulemuris TaxID=1765219 RepID=A0A261GE46_9BIFI|nr:ATP-binding protein [Bifidobacterium eulemuris]OZG69395.1 AAA domain-containing protein [Bifidobacterium eulemuris]QOL31121.1 ATP-binding protein [Bifidobacterium eulemuris]
MLIDFSFENVTSFRDEQAFSMTRDARFVEEGGPSISTVTAVYGANASGKSNFLYALHSMRDMVVTSYSAGDGTSDIHRDPFLLRENPNDADTAFYVSFIATDGQKYRYWFRFDDHVIHEEELSVYKIMDEESGKLSTHPSRLFARNETVLEFGPSFRGPKAQVKKTVELRPNALALSACAAAGIECTQSAFEFFSTGFGYYGGGGFDKEYPFILEQFNQQNDFSKKLAALVKYADFGISGLRSVPVEVDANMFERLKHKFVEELGADEQKLEKLFTPQQQTRLMFRHGGERSFAMLGVEQESDGTLAALAFFSLALRVLSRPSVTLVDKIDTSLHPTLVKELVSLFVDPQTNLHGSQLIFTTHDASLINVTGTADRLIDPDQIRLVEKNGDGASEIYPVTDLKVRKGENIGKNYLNGVYGATPRPNFHEAFAEMMSLEH